MILGYEQPVDIPVMSIYDKQAIRDYIGAVQKDYEDTNEAFDKFQEKYGDFISPIEGASEDYYNTGVGAVMNAYDDYVRRGGDPIRSVEGRAALRRAMRGIDRAKLAKMRESADNYRKYIDDVQKKKDAGKYNPYQEGVALVLAGYGPKDKSLEDMTEQELINLGTNPTTYFNNNDLWARTGADPYKTIADYWDPIFKDVPGRTTTATITGEDGRTVQVFGTKRGEDINKPIVQQHAESFYGTGAGAYSHLKTMLDRLRQTNPNATMDDAKKALEDQVAKQYIKEDFNLDPAYTSRFDRTGRGGGGGGRGYHGNRYSGNGSGNEDEDLGISQETDLLSEGLSVQGYDSLAAYDKANADYANSLIQRDEKRGIKYDKKSRAEAYAKYSRHGKQAHNMRVLDDILADLDDNYDSNGNQIYVSFKLGTSKDKKGHFYQLGSQKYGYKTILAKGAKVLDEMSVNDSAGAYALVCFDPRQIDVETGEVDLSVNRLRNKLVSAANILHRMGGDQIKSQTDLAETHYIKPSGKAHYTGNVVPYYNAVKGYWEKAAVIEFENGRTMYYPLKLDPSKPSRGVADKLFNNAIKQTTKAEPTPLQTYGEE